MSKKPLHLQQKRYEVRPCHVSSTRALDGYVVRWYIHDKETDTYERYPTLARSSSYSTRRNAVKALNIRLVQNERSEQAKASDRCVGLERRFRLI